MKRMIEGSFHIVGAMLRSTVAITLAILIIIGFGIMKVTALNQQLDEAQAQIRRQNVMIEEKNATIAEQDTTIIRMGQEMAELKQQLDEVGQEPTITVRVQFRLFGAGLFETHFDRTVSREIFDSIQVGDDITDASWMAAPAPSNFVGFRFFVDARVE